MDVKEFVEKAKKTNELEKAEHLRNKYHIIYSEDENFRVYQNGYYQVATPQAIDNIIVNEFGCLKSVTLNLIIRYLKARAERLLAENQNKNILNLKNGLFDIDTYELKPHDPEIISRNQFPFDYEPDAPCPEWEAAIKEILQSQEQIDLFQEMFGLCFTQEVYGKALVFYGATGKNGKSTLLKVLKEMLGPENICAIEPTQLDKAHNIARLDGKLANICTELSVRGVVADGPLKSIITGDPIEGCHKYLNSFTFDPYCKILYACNELPYIEDKTNAFYERLVILNFDREFTAADEKYKHERTLLKEKSGIFRWSVEGFKRLRARGRFELSQTMIETKENYKKENNPQMLFIEEWCIVAENAQIECSLLYTNYLNYCMQNGYKPLSQIRFSKRLRELLRGKVVYDKDRRPWRFIGINLRSAHEAVQMRDEDAAIFAENKAKAEQDLFKKNGYGSYITNQGSDNENM